MSEALNLSNSPEAMDVSLEKDGGVMKTVLRAGPNPSDLPGEGDTVHVHYVGTLDSDGSQFDSSRERPGHFSFTLGRSQVIKGWDIGVATMAKGELAMLVIRPELGYGEAGSPPKIPPGATLRFEIELLDFEGEDISPEKNKGIVKRILSKGEGHDTPNEDSSVVVDLEVRKANDNSVIRSEENLSFVVGEGEEQGVPKGVELAVLKMKRKERAQLHIKSVYHDVVGASDIFVVVTLKSLERAKESWQLDGRQKLEEAKKLKDRGNVFVKANKIEMARKKYARVVDFLEHEISLKGDEEEERKAVLQAGRLNLALCLLKQQEYLEARKSCDKVIDEDDECEKALFRRAEAYAGLNEHELAVVDLEKVLKLDANNKAAKNKLLVSKQKIKMQNEKEKRLFANMFDRFAASDARRQAKSKEERLEINEWDNKEKKVDQDDKLKVSGDVDMDIDLTKEDLQEEKPIE